MSHKIEKSKDRIKRPLEERKYHAMHKLSEPETGLGRVFKRIVEKIEGYKL